MMPHGSDRDASDEILPPDRRHASVPGEAANRRGVQLFRRDLLEHARVESNGAMIDTELLAGAKARRFVIANIPVTHLARTTGHPTGANVRVILRAFGDLVRFRVRLSRDLRDERRGGRR
jgi:hypothetical protein